MSLTDLSPVMQPISALFEIAGVITIIIGFIIALVRAGQCLIGGRDARGAYDVIRSVFGRSVLLGLEILVAADLIRTVAVDPTLNSLWVLFLLVIIRTFLSWALEVELEGVWPWRKKAMELQERAEAEKACQA